MGRSQRANCTNGNAISGVSRSTRLAGRASGSRAAGDALPFVFYDIDGGVTRTTMTYLPAADRWTWTIDEDGHGGSTAFARVTLRRP